MSKTPKQMVCIFVCIIANRDFRNLRRGRQRERHKTIISLVKTGKIIVLRVRTHFSTYFCGTLDNNDVKGTLLNCLVDLALEH